MKKNCTNMMRKISDYFGSWNTSWELAKQYLFYEKQLHEFDREKSATVNYSFTSLRKNPLGIIT